MTDHALLLVNLGSPASTEVADVRRYLNQFLMDPYVIDVPWPVRRLIVSIILARRPAQSAHAYASIWWEEGSPLVVLTRRLQAVSGPRVRWKSPCATASRRCRPCSPGWPPKALKR
jgi:ferrochelatase